MLICKMTFLYTICHHQSNVISPIPIIAEKLLPFPWEFHSNGTSHSHDIIPIQVGIPF